MDFEDFCHHFTDVVVCRLVERALLWPTPHWKEARLYGEWTPAPSSHQAPSPPATNPSNHALSLVRTNSTYGGTDQQGNRKEARLGESQAARGKDGRREQDEDAMRMTEEVNRGEERGWEEQIDKRSRCGGCINHMDTFLHNPQVGTRATTHMDLTRRETERGLLLQFMFEARSKAQEVLICLQQEDRRSRRKDGEGENLPIGFEVLKVRRAVVQRKC